MRIKSLLASLILCLSLWTVPAGAAPVEDNPCDPDNGKYICDGTEDQPIADDDNPCDPDNGKYICDGTEDQPIADDDNPCDPDNGKYICDGTEDWPDGKCPPEVCGPSMPSTGVSNIDDGADALVGGNVPRGLDVLHR